MPEKGHLLLALGLHIGADFLRFLAGAADLACKAFTGSPLC